VARRSAQTTPRIVVKFSDWNTQPPGCTECFNFFHREIVLEEQWTRYTVLFDSVEQYPNWGAPRPERIDPTRLYGIMFEANEAGHPFDVWIDDIAFIEKTPGQK
jgi:hypothetical protein